MTEHPGIDPIAVDIGIVIVTYNNAGDVDALIDSIPAACEGLSWAAVVVDNDSSDATVELLEAHGANVIRMGRNAGYAAALNVGIEHFQNARSILISNPDIVLFPGALAPALRELDDPRVGVVAPQLRAPGGRLGHTQRRTLTIGRALGMTLLGGKLSTRSARMSDLVIDPQAYLRPQDVDWAVGALLLISRQCIETVGLWDESFFLYSEETDYCERVADAGLVTRYIPVPAGRHEGGGGVHQPRLRSMMAVNRVRLYARRHSTASSYLFLLVAVLSEGSRALSGNDAAKQAVQALLRPSKRPIEIQCSDSFLPR